MKLSRRHFLASTAAVGVIGAVPPLLQPRPAMATTDPVTTLRIEKRAIEVLGRAADVFGLVQPDGTHGLFTEAGRRFRVRLENRVTEKALIHWHGLTPPWQQDGVPDLSQPALPASESYDYDFPLAMAGTNWMHSHHGLQEQRLMAAPLIIRDPAEVKSDVQEVVVLLHDFTFRDPKEILMGLQAGGPGAAHSAPTAAVGHSSPMPQMDHSSMGHSQPAITPGHGPAVPRAVHLHDIEYDAFLANDRTLRDPSIFRVERGARVRLRLINAATATHFWVDLDRLEGRLVAVDGVPVEPITGRQFEFAIAQRLDLLLELPRGDGAWPIFAVREGDTKRTGFVLATKNGRVPLIPVEAPRKADAVGLRLERQLRAASPLSPRPADRRHTITITEEPGYIWKLNGTVHGQHIPLTVRAGERVEITFVDQTSMAHPMHLHGHHFQVVAINSERFAGAVRDTVLVPARGNVTIAFEANNPGKWALHCHHLYHMAGGMMTTVEYQS